MIHLRLKQHLYPYEQLPVFLNSRHRDNLKLVFTLAQSSDRPIQMLVFKTIVFEVGF